jgi:hypothetical protein
VFAMTYERVSRSVGPAASLFVSLCIAGILATVMSKSIQSPWLPLSCAVALCILALLILPNPSTTPRTIKLRHLDVPATALVAGGASALISAQSQLFGAFWCDIVASLPIISAIVVVHQHATGIHDDVQRFLRGYVLGLMGKAFFAAAFSFAILHTAVDVALFSASILSAITLLVSSKIRQS